MAEPKVSVLVTFYNQEKYVNIALESILSQKTDFGIKVLVGDDGSTDNTVAIVKEWITRYPGIIELYTMERDAGPDVSLFRASRNRLNLLDHVDTDYFIFLDGDDFYCSDRKLQTQFEILEKEENNDCIACGHNMYMQYSDGSRKPAMGTDLKECKVEAKKYWRDLYIHTDTLLIRSSVITQINKELLENCFDDVVITFSVIQHGKIYYLPDLWVVYAFTGDGICTGGNEIENAINSIMMFDLCQIINPAFNTQSKVKFSQIWKSLMKNRKDIKPEAFRQYSDDAQKKNLKYTYKWIHYSELRAADKLKLHFAYYSVRVHKFLTNCFK